MVKKMICCYDVFGIQIFSGDLITYAVDHYGPELHVGIVTHISSRKDWLWSNTKPPVIKAITAKKRKNEWEIQTNGRVQTIGATERVMVLAGICGSPFDGQEPFPKLRDLYDKWNEKNEEAS